MATSVQSLSLLKTNTSDYTTNIRWRQTTLWFLLVLVALVIIIVNVVARFVFLKSPVVPTSTLTATSISTLPALGITKKGDESIGISDGSFVFDTTCQGASSKLLAAQAIYRGIKILAVAHILMMLATTSADVLSGISPYFFRVAPSNKMQAIAGADYATNTLHATKVVVFVDQGKLYSQSLAQHFLDRFRANGGQIVAEEQYVVGKPENLGRLLNNALEQIASRG